MQLKSFKRLFFDYLDACTCNAGTKPGQIDYQDYYAYYLNKDVTVSFTENSNHHYESV